MKRTNHLGIAIKNVSAIGSCPLIDAMAERIVNDLEWSAESEFDNCEEDIIISLIAESYRREAYTEAINILILTFSLIHNLEDVMLLDIIGSCPESFCSDKPKSIETVHSRRNRLTVLLN